MHLIVRILLKGGNANLAIKIRYNTNHNDVYLATCDRGFFRFYVLDSGVLTPLQFMEREINPRTFVQGHEQICNCNSVKHVHIDGEITAMPYKDKKLLGTVERIDYSGGSYVYKFIDYFHIAGLTLQLCSDSEYRYKERHIKLFQTQTGSVYSSREMLQPDDSFYNYEPGYHGYSETDTANWPDLLQLADLPSAGGGNLSLGKIDISHTANKYGNSVYQVDGYLLNLGNVTFPVPSLSGLEPHLGNDPVPPDNLLVRLSEKIGPLQVNNIANVQQLRKWKEMIPRIPNKKIKTLAGLYLWYKYVFCTTAMDAEEMFKFFTRNPLEAYKSRDKGYDHRFTLTNIVDEKTVDTFTFYLGSYDFSILDTFGLRVNLSNTWDMIPFSFVVDWFTRVGDMLASIDAAEFWAQVPVSCYTQSRKTSKRYFVENCISNLVQTSYIRDVSTELPSVVISPSLNMPSRHLPEAISLILANKKSR